MQILTALSLALFLTIILVFVLRRCRRCSDGDIKRAHPPALPIIGHFHLLGPLLHRAFQDLAVRYSLQLMFLRLGSVPFVVASSPALARELLKTSELCFTSRLNTVASKRLTYSTAIAFSPYGEYWKLARRLTVTELLGPRPISAFASLRAAETRRFLRRVLFSSSGGGAVNLTGEIKRAASAVVTKMVLGSSGMDEARLKEAQTVARDVATIFGELNLSDFVWFLRKFDLQGFGKRIEDIHRRFDRLLESIIGEREELKKISDSSSTVATGFLDVLLRQLDDSSDKDNDSIQFTRLHIKGIIVDLFTAGTDTTAVSVEWALAKLINHPKVLEKAREEIDKVVGKTRLVNESDIPNLPYIQAVVKEVMRLHPAVPLVMRQCVKECEVSGHVIPKGSVVIVNSWAIARDPEYWEKPLEFRPERFVEAQAQGQGPQVDVKGQNFELLPFGSGRRICPGMNMALQIVPTLVASVIQCFDLEVVGSPTKDGSALSMEEGPGITAPRVNNLVCVPVPRFAQLSTLLHEP